MQPYFLKLPDFIFDILNKTIDINSSPLSVVSVAANRARLCKSGVFSSHCACRCRIEISLRNR